MFSFQEKKISFASTLSFLIFTLLFSACMPKQGYYFEEPGLTSINIIDRNGLSETINNPERLCQYQEVDFLQPQPYQKVLRIYSRTEQGNIPSCITSYHPNGYVKQYLEVMNSRAFGAYKEWYPNGVQRIDATIIEGVADLVEGTERTWVFDGCCKIWNETGCLMSLIPYLKGDLEGDSIYYHTNGNVWKRVPYHKGLLNGLVEIYQEDNSLLQRSRYKNGVKEGELERFWAEQKLASEEIYCEGLLSTGRYYNNCGEQIASIDQGNGTRAIFGKDAVCQLQEYHCGMLDGEVKVFDKYSRVCNQYHVKNCMKHGEEICYYDAVRLQQKLVPKLSLMWYEGKIQGVVKTWYDNGVQESQREMSNNKRNGHSTAWYRDGSLMLIEEYELDKLVRGEYYSKGERFPVSSIEEGKGIATLFDAEGNFVSKVEYRNGKPYLED